MRVALCLSGHLREFEKAYPSIKTHLLDVFQPDVFISTWDERGYWTANDEKAIDDAAELTERDFKLCQDLYLPKLIQHEKLTESKKKEFLECADNIILKYNSKMRWGRKQNIIGAFYKLFIADQLRCEYQVENGFEYDFVIRARPDLCIHSCPLLLLKNSSEQPVQVFRDCSGLLQDSIWATSGKQMELLCLLYRNLETICAETHCLFEFHDILDKALSFYKFKLLEVPMSYTILNTPNGYCYRGNFPESAKKKY